jgi:uncharacterized membrane protein
MLIKEYNTKDILYIFIVSIIFLVLDGTWLYLMRNIFGLQIKEVQNSVLKIKIIPSVFTYIIMTLGFYHFIIKERKSCIDGLFLGIFVYGVYELTNYSSLDNWKLQTVIIDTLWGGFLFCISTIILYSIYNTIEKDKIYILKNST